MTDKVIEKNGKMAKTRETPEDLKFDLEAFSYGWARDWAKVVGKIHKARMVAGMAPSDDLTADEQMEVFQQMAEVLDELEVLIDQRDALIQEVLVAVPSDWLITKAPEDYTVDKHGLRYLKAWAVERLQEEVMKAQQESSKNL